MLLNNKYNKTCINNANDKIIRMIFTYLLVIGIIICFCAFSSETSVNAAKFDPDKDGIKVNSVRYLLGETGSNPKGRTDYDILAPGPDYDINLFDMSEFGILLPGEQIESYVDILNDVSPARTREVIMTIRKRPGADLKKPTLDEILNLKVESDNRAIYGNGINPVIYNGIITAAYDTQYRFKFTAGTSASLHFTATVIGGKLENNYDVLPDYMKTLKGRELQQAYNDRYMGSQASFQVILKVVDIPPPITYEPPPETTPAPTSPPNTTNSTDTTDSTEPTGGYSQETTKPTEANVIRPTVSPSTTEYFVPPPTIDITEEITGREPPLIIRPSEEESTSYTSDNITNTTPEIPITIPTLSEEEDIITSATPPLAKMPQTGESDPFGSVAVGITLILMGCIMVSGMSRKNSKNKGR